MNLSSPNEVPFETLRLRKLGLRGYMLLVVLPLALVALGIYAYVQQRVHGDVVTGLRAIGGGGAPWGLYIIFYTYFVGLAVAGVAVATGAYLFRVQGFPQVTRVAEFLAVVTPILALLCVLANQGRPVAALMNLPRYAQVASPFFGSFTLLVGVNIAASLVMLYLGGRGDAAWCGRRAGPFRWAYRIWASGYTGNDNELRRHRKARFWLSLAVFPLIVLAYSTQGLIFGVQGGRPGWFGSLWAPSMLVEAGIAGLGLLMAIAGFMHLRLEVRQLIPGRLFTRLGNTLIALVSVFFYIVVIETLTERYVGREAEVRVADAIVFGAYAPAFWGMLVLFAFSLVVLAVQFLRRKPMIGWMILVGLVLNLAAVLRRYLAIVPAQTHGHLLGYESGIYLPSATEVAVLTGIICVGVLCFVVFMRLFPIVALHTYHGRIPGPSEAEPRRRTWLRLSLTSATFAGGLALMAFGFAMSSRLGTDTFLDPAFPLSPMIFILGIVMTLYSAAVYVVVPPG